jgi:ketosteroid isomerase-like protein
MADDAKAVVERFYGVIGTLDEEGLRGVLHDDAELHQPPTLPYGGRIYRGPEEMIPLWRDTIMKLADPTSFQMESMLVQDDIVAVIASAKGATTGKPVTCVEEYRVREGKIDRIRMFWFDPAPMAEEANALTAA